jgi:hypothetical protein
MTVSNALTFLASCSAVIMTIPRESADIIVPKIGALYLATDE